MKLIWKLLRENISKVQLIGFFIANLIGLSIVLVAVQFYSDVNPIFTQKGNIFNRDFYTITKKVGLLDALSTKSSAFSAKEIEDLKKMGFIKDVGVFTPSQFNVRAGISRNNVAFQTEMFFESVPTQFIDIKTDDWRFSPVDNTIPIILPKNYLDLYNFGFAESRSMPKLSENMIGMIALDIVIQSNSGQYKQMKGRIVGFSNRLNTILVPESFMEWANQKYGNHATQNTSRLIAEVNNITDPQVASYFKEKGYEVEGDNAAVSRMSSLLKILIGIVVGVGAIICVLSFMILILSIYLLLEKNMDKLRKLRLIGYKKSVVARPYELLVIGINLTVFLLALVVVAIAQSEYCKLIQKVWSTLEPTNLQLTIFIGLAIFLVLTSINIVIIRRKVK